MYLKKSQSRNNRVSFLSAWGEINFAKRLVFASIMFGMIFVPMFNTPQAYAGLDITSQYFDEDDYLTTSPVGTASVKTEIETYVVQEGDTIGSLANKFNISSFTISQVNGLAWDAKLKVGQEVKIPPVSGLIHKVKKGDTVSSLAKKYSTTKEVILYQNGMESEDTLVVDKELIIPGGIMPAPPRNSNTSGSRVSYSNSWQPSASQLPSIDSAGTLVKPSNNCRYTQYYHYGLKRSNVLVKSRDLQILIWTILSGSSVLC